MFFKKGGVVPDTDVFLKPEDSLEVNYQLEKTDLRVELREIKNILYEILRVLKR